MAAQVVDFILNLGGDYSEKADEGAAATSGLAAEAGKAAAGVAAVTVAVSGAALAIKGFVDGICRGAK